MLEKEQFRSQLVDKEKAIDFAQHIVPPVHRAAKAISIHRQDRP